MTNFEIDPADLSVTNSAPALTPDVAAILAKLLAKLPPGEDNRKSDRRPLSITVPVVPVDGDGHPVEAPFMAMSRDISPRGICLIHTQAPKSDLLLIELRASRSERVKLFVEVVHCRSVGRSYEIDGRFLATDLDQ